MLNLGIMANFMTLIACICFSGKNPEIPSHVSAPVDETCYRRQTAVFYRGVSNTTIWNEEPHKRNRNLPVCFTGTHAGNENSKPCPVLLELPLPGCWENIWALTKWDSGK